MQLALIQLVSEQTMQNLLPPLALKPNRLVHLTSASALAIRSGYIAEALRQAGLKIGAKDVRLLSAMPSIAETAKAVMLEIDDLKEHGFTPLVNFTGGTKLMSIGAYAGASKKKTTCLYVDTASRVFVDGNTGPALKDVMGDDLSFTSLMNRLRADVVAVANGCERITGGKDWRKYRDFAARLISHPEDERACWEAFYGDAGICPKGRTPRQPADWLAILGKSLNIPKETAALAVDAQLLEMKGASFLLPQRERSALRSESRIRWKAAQNLQEIVGIMTGGWWEICVIDAADKSRLFRDLRWSVKVGDRDVGSDLEEDIIALDGVEIVCISCKRGGERSRLLPLLEELDARAERVGGRFTRKFLAVYIEPPPFIRKNLSKRARELNITLLFGRNALLPENFAGPHGEKL